MLSIEPVSSEYWVTFWQTFRNLVEGEILYYPKTPLTESIMKNGNETFVTLDTIRIFGEDLIQNNSEMFERLSKLISTFAPSISRNQKEIVA